MLTAQQIGTFSGTGQELLIYNRRERRTRVKKLSLACALILSAITFSGCARSESPIVGVWEGRMNELPAVELTVRDGDGGLGGTIVFFFQRKDTGVWKVERQGAEPLVDSRFDGKKLSFKISHLNAHTDSSPNDPPVSFNFTLAAPGEGELTSNYQGQESAIKLVKTK